MQDLTGMAVFARVVDAGSFSAAARALGLSKSAVSKQVRRLEEELKVRLLNRTTRQLSLTEAGTAFYQGCQRVVAEAEAAVDAVDHLAASVRGTLRVNAPMSFGATHLAPALADFMPRCPELRVDLTLNDRRVDLVEEGYDLAVRIGTLADSSLVARRLAPNRTILVAAPAYLERRGGPQVPEDLNDHEGLYYSYLDGVVWRLAGPDGDREVRPVCRLQINNGGAILNAACAGLGVAFLPTFICGDAVRDGRLLRVLPDWEAGNQSGVHVIFPPRANLLPKVRVFIDFLAERFAGPPSWDRGLFEPEGR